LRCEPGTNLLLADDAELFAQHVITLLNDPSLRQRLGEEGRRIAESYYGWDASARALDRLYRQYLGGCGETELELAVEQGGRS
jgi:glycosyltransferase involved in cell wall biosynthesis